MLDISRQQPVSPTHHSPVVFVGDSTNGAYLIVVTVGIDAWPSEAVVATSSQEPFQKVHCLTPSFRLLQVSSHRLKNGFG
jgi:hypothetical protein